MDPPSILEIILILIFTGIFGWILGKVFFFGWLTALATGTGALPFVCFSHPSKIILGVANALASGMMVSASMGLLIQGNLSSTEISPPILLTIAGAGAGWIFIIVAKKATDGVSIESSLGFGSGVDAKKMLLVVFVMVSTERVGLQLHLVVKLSCRIINLFACWLCWCFSLDSSFICGGCRHRCEFQCYQVLRRTNLSFSSYS